MVGGGGGTANNPKPPMALGASVHRWETSVKSCEAEHCDHPERTGRQAAGK